MWLMSLICLIPKLHLFFVQNNNLQSPLNLASEGKQKTQIIYFKIKFRINPGNKGLKSSEGGVMNEVRWSYGK